LFETERPRGFEKSYPMEVCDSHNEESKKEIRIIITFTIVSKISRNKFSKAGKRPIQKCKSLRRRRH
jgi:hypothetical protein